MFKTLCIFCIYLNTTSLHTWIYHFRITLDPIMLNILYLSINYNLNGLYLQYLIHSNIFYFLFHFHEHITITAFTSLKTQRDFDFDCFKIFD